MLVYQSILFVLVSRLSCCLGVVIEPVCPHDLCWCEQQLLAGSPKQDGSEGRGQTKYNSDLDALHEGCGQSNATEENPKEMRANSSVLGPRRKVPQYEELWDSATYAQIHLQIVLVQA